MTEEKLKGIGFHHLQDKPTFIAELARLYFKQWGHEVKDRSLEIEQRELEESLQVEGVPVVIIATSNGDLLGAGQLKWKEMSIYLDKEYWLGAIYVKEEYQGKGLAKRLIERLIGQAKELKIERLYLQTEQLDGGLYKQLGWEPLEQLHYHGVEVLVMEKAIL